jgi:ribosomal protein L14E/L6E/L27E
LCKAFNSVKIRKTKEEKPDFRAPKKKMKTAKPRAKPISQLNPLMIFFKIVQTSRKKMMVKRLHPLELENQWDHENRVNLSNQVDQLNQEPKLLSRKKEMKEKFLILWPLMLTGKYIQPIPK